MEKFKNFGRAAFRAAQQLLVPAMLLLVYIFAVGALAALARVYRLLPGRGKNAAAFWKQTDPRTETLEEAAEQS